MQGIGLAVVLVGISGAIGTFITGEASTLVFIISLVMGGLIGEILGIEQGFHRLAAAIEGKVSKGKDGFAKGFITGSILYCVGTMAIVGSIESGVLQNHDILFAKSALDGITAVIFGAAMGPGVIFSFVPVFIYQGAITLASGLAADYITDPMMDQISVIGGILVFAIGLNLLGITKIKLANFLPAIFVPVVYYGLAGLFT